jgi:hypothetical protein
MFPNKMGSNNGLKQEKINKTTYWAFFCLFQKNIITFAKYYLHHIRHIKMRTAFITLVALSFPFSMIAQDGEKGNTNDLLNHLDIGVTMGTTGIGIDLASPICENVQFRTGFAFIPHFDYNMQFDVETYTTDENNVSKFSSNFGKISEMMKTITGYEIDQHIDMIGQPRFYNFKFLVDVFPFRNKKWHITGGFYLGPSTIAKAYNTTEDMPTLLGVNLYNKMYDYIMSEKYLDEPIYNGTYLDPVLGSQLETKMQSYGRLGIHIADYKKEDSSTGDEPCMLVPDKDGMMKAEVRVNSFKPYIGFGYGNAMCIKKKQFNISFDCGLMFWGGTPKVLTSNALDSKTEELKEVDLVNDVKNVKGKVGTYVDLIKVFKVFPVINLKIAYRIF